MAGPVSWSGDVAAFLRAPPEGVASALLREALLRARAAPDWAVALDLRLLRLRRRIDAVLATDRAVFALQVRPEARAFTAADRLAAEDAALDLADFHRGCRDIPVIPVVLVPNGATPSGQFPLALAGAAPVVEATRLSLPLLLQFVASSFPRLGRRWDLAGYAPVPALMDAACLLYARHGVEALRLAGAGPDGVARTHQAVDAAVRAATERGERLVVFVTGEPGAGKTLCGLDLAFARATSCAFLTGNPTLVHVLREALVRDAVARGAERRAVTRRVEAVIQALPAFRDHYLMVSDTPPERLVVIDEAQRCWSQAHAVSKTQNRPVKLGDSEPGHLLDILARQEGKCAVVCLVGGGQEIHDGEGGLAAWGEALRARPAWRALAPEQALRAADARQRLQPWDRLDTSPDLHLATPIRAVARPMTAAWVDAVLADRPAEAAVIARNGVRFAVTRSLLLMRAALRPRGSRTAGLVASSGARRLRAEGLGATLPHQDADVVARWFLDRWPDIRSGDALEVVASEFGVQGLELDRVGLCWDVDLIRDGRGWVARRFRASAWTRAGPEVQANRINAYRVLLTRARHGTVIWVPEGCKRDSTRDPAAYDAVFDYLVACGAEVLDAKCVQEDNAPHVAEPALL